MSQVPIIGVYGFCKQNWRIGNILRKGVSNNSPSPIKGRGFLVTKYMNKDQMAKQAQILRRKRYARRINVDPQIRQGVVRLDKPLSLPNRPKEASLNHLNQSDLRRLRAEKILEYKKRMIAQQKSKQQKSKQQSHGCGRCRRKNRNV